MSDENRVLQQSHVPAGRMVHWMLGGKWEPLTGFEVVNLESADQKEAGLPGRESHGQGFRRSCTAALWVTEMRGHLRLPRGRLFPPHGWRPPLDSPGARHLLPLDVLRAGAASSRR